MVSPWGDQKGVGASRPMARLAAVGNGWLDRERLTMETLKAISRAGAGIILPCWATEVAGWLS